MHEFTGVMKALSDPNRVKIIKMLQHKELCVCEIQALLGIAQPTVSKHLKVLDDAGLVVLKKRGLWVYCHLSDGSTNAYVATLLGNLRHWLEETAECSELREKIDSVSSNDMCNRSRYSRLGI